MARAGAGAARGEALLGVPRACDAATGALGEGSELGVADATAVSEGAAAEAGAGTSNGASDAECAAGNCADGAWFERSNKPEASPRPNASATNSHETQRRRGAGSLSARSSNGTTSGA